jgi:hypothetical protein
MGIQWEAVHVSLAMINSLLEWANHLEFMYPLLNFLTKIYYGLFLQISPPYQHPWGIVILTEQGGTSAE